MTSARQGLGRLGENLAAQELERRGYEIVGRNVRTAGGEIDLVARDSGRWVFVEVRARRGRAYGTPEESITPRKQARMLRAAQSYLAENELDDPPWRMDVVAVELSPQGELLRVDVIQNAVTE